MSTVGKTLDNFEDSWRMLNSNLWMFATPLDPWRIQKKRADNHAVTERSDVKSSRLRLPSESWAEENLLPWELFYWRPGPNTALERRQRNTSVQLSGCTKMHQVSYQVSLWRRGIPTGRCRGQCFRLRLWECLPTLPCTASIAQPGKAKQLRWQPFGMQVSSCWRNGFKSPHYISLHLIASLKTLVTLVLLTSSHIFSHGSHFLMVLSWFLSRFSARCQELLEAGADATLLRVNPETWRCGHFDLNF